MNDPALVLRSTRSRLAARAARQLIAFAAIGALALPVALLTTTAGAPGAAASSSARVSVSGPDGHAHADLQYSTTLTLRGSGFQSVKGGFGGIYVLFGWVDDPQGGSWRPSQGGETGTDLRYVPDSESKDNKGFEKFVSFPGSDTEYAANGGEIHADGTWKTTLVVPGPTFESQDRAGKTVSVDCRKVRCGVITIGAHGVVSPSNESFTPVDFVDLQAGSGDGSSGGSGGAAGDAQGAAAGSEKAAGAGAGAAAGSGAGAARGSGDAAAGEQGADGTTPTRPGATASPSAAGSAADAPATATVGIDRTTAVAGRAMTFVAQGFTPGERVVATFDDGVLAVGPLTAGAQGDVAGLLQLPDDTRLGTHTLKVTGARSGQDPEVELTVRRDPAEASAADATRRAASAAQGSDDGWSPAEIAVGGAALLLVAVVVSSFVTARRRSRGTGPAAAEDGGDRPAGPPADSSGETFPDPFAESPRTVPVPALEPALEPGRAGPPTQPVPAGRHS